MAKPRKKWATSLSPATRTTYESQAAAYRAVKRYAHEYALGMLRPGLCAVTVYVDERDGRGWKQFEHIWLREVSE